MSVGERGIDMVFELNEKESENLVSLLEAVLNRSRHGIDTYEAVTKNEITELEYSIKSQYYTNHRAEKCFK